MQDLEADRGGIVKRQSRRMMSLAMYRKLSAEVGAWNHEAQGKARALRVACFGLVLVLGSCLMAMVWVPRAAGLVLLAGYSLWIACVAVATWWYLRTPARQDDA